MTEASITQDLITCLKRQLPGAVVFKISDRITKGVPDLCVAWQGYTTWVEVKLWRAGVSLDKLCPPLQRHTLAELNRETHGRAWYVVYDVRKKDEKRTVICGPGKVAAAGDQMRVLDPVSCARRHGISATLGFAHDCVGELIRATHETY